MNTQEKRPQSDMDAAFERIAVNACGMLRGWSDSDGRIGPPRICEFQAHLKQTIAAVYFGTADGLPESR